MHFSPKTLLLSCLLGAVIIPATKATDASNENVKICMDPETKAPWPFSLFIPPKCDGLERKAIVHLPPLPDAKGEKPKIPLVINIHALGSYDLFQQIYTNFDEIADEEKFVVVYPNGHASARVATKNPGPLGKTFNAGGCCADACHTEPKIDDIGFFRKLVEHIKTEMPKNHNFEIDTQRIYATGMSNGGFMTNRVACEMSDIVAAVVPVAGPLMNEKADGTDKFMWTSDPFLCAPGRPVPLMHLHSREDPIVPFNGSTQFGFPAIESSSIKKWKSINGVADAEPVVTYDEDITKCTSYGPGTDASVTLCVMESNLHCWPGKDLPLQCDSEIGNRYIWEFFSNHTLEGGFSPPTKANGKDEL